MKVCFISDTHNLHYDMTYTIPECELLIHAGDCMNTGNVFELPNFLEWYNSLNQAKTKVLIAGNHDWAFYNYEDQVRAHLVDYDEIIYLQDQSVLVDDLKIYGSPWQPEFCNWAFNLPRNGTALKEKWAAIPNDTDIVVTHGPAKNILDLTTYDHYNAGCERLYKRLKSLKPLVHVGGHIHEGYGIDQRSIRGVVCVNPSICTLRYNPINKPLVLDVDKKTRTVKVIDE